MKTLPQELALDYLQRISDFNEGTTLRSRLILSTIQFLNPSGYSYHDEIGRQYAFLTATISGSSKGSLAVLLLLEEYRNSSWNNFRIQDISFTPETIEEVIEEKANYVIPVEMTKAFSENYIKREAEHKRDLLLDKAEKRLRTREEIAQSRKARQELKKKLRLEDKQEKEELLNYVLPKVNPLRGLLVEAVKETRPEVNTELGLGLSPVFVHKPIKRANTTERKPRKNALLVKNGVLVSGIDKNYRKPSKNCRKFVIVPLRNTVNTVKENVNA